MYGLNHHFFCNSYGYEIFLFLNLHNPRGMWTTARNLDFGIGFEQHSSHPASLAELALVVEAPGVILPDVLRHEPYPHLPATLLQFGHLVQVEEGKKVGENLPG